MIRVDQSFTNPRSPLHVALRQVRQVPSTEVQYVDREVPNVTYQALEQIVEVPQAERRALRRSERRAERGERFNLLRCGSCRVAKLGNHWTRGEQKRTGYNCILL